jgi:hypothetical protein
MDRDIQNFKGFRLNGEPSKTNLLIYVQIVFIFVVVSKEASGLFRIRFTKHKWNERNKTVNSK